ncbi:Dabb family protein [Catalinimonas niigatensis]|uniref:Dabb family protein n=1 Tax=Catalinimonas niigatensis TaxID=1397264 RepID=UPI00266557D1|nr:Dabb family protein [Catalinimonas niigatensis]WPP52436.1 Dabb family protein [Catalinimonas niigatensis]
MKKISIALSLILALTASSFIIHMQQQEETLKHVVVFKYKENASKADIKKVTDAFRALQDKIPGITDFEYGINNSPEGKNMGFTHVYTLTFENAAARDTYLPHPEHKKFGELLGTLGVLEDAFVVDYHPAE